MGLFEVRRQLWALSSSGNLYKRPGKKKAFAFCQLVLTLIGVITRLAAETFICWWKPTAAGFQCRLKTS